MKKDSGITFCIFGHFLVPYVQRGIVPHLAARDHVKLESFLSIQLKPGDEDPTDRLERIVDSARKGRRLVFCLDAVYPAAVLAIKDHRVVGRRCGVIAKMPNHQCWRNLSSIHAKTPFSFVLAVGRTSDLSELFPGIAVDCDSTNQFLPSERVRDFVVEHLAEVEA